ncbi:MAG: DNA polymerase ligase N-terminal domain-containing protein [Thermoguttaceae bacterium]
MAALRFVVLRHDHPRGVHFDWMFETGETLKTWSLPRPPLDGDEMDCQRLADHRRAYLDYEGPVSGGRGDVTRWDSGTYAILQQTDDEWTVFVTSEKLHGRATFHRIAGGDLWRAFFRGE